MSGFISCVTIHEFGWIHLCQNHLHKSLKFYENLRFLIEINEKPWFRGTEERVSEGRKECLSVSKECLWGSNKMFRGSKRKSLGVEKSVSGG